MKKPLFIILICFLLISTVKANIITVTVANFSFTPQNITLNVGDSVKWVWSSGTHTTTSTSIPTGAASWDSPMTSSSTSFVYKVTVAGTYNYKCSVHPSMMTGTITATNPTTAINSLNDNAFRFSVYPNPFTKNIVVDFNNMDLSGNSPEIQVLDILGKVYYKLKPTDTQIKNGKVTIELDFLNDGVYFIYLSAAQKRTAIKVVKNESLY